MSSNTVSSSLRDKVPLSDLLSLDVSEMFIIQNLMRFPNNKSLAIDLRNQLNANLKNGKKISTSSFYNKLRKLKKNNFISYQQDDSTGKIYSIEVTEKAFYAMSEIKIISTFATTNIAEFIEEMLPAYLKSVGLKFIGEPIYENVLLVSLEHGKDLRIFERLCQFGKNTFLVNQVYDDEFGLDEDLVKVIEHTDGTIFMPDKFFDACVVVGYDCNEADSEIPGKVWLSEVYRLLKSGGMVHVSSIDALPKTDHFIIDSMIDELNDSPWFRHIGGDELVAELDKTGFQNSNFYRYKGMILGYGYK